LADSSGNADEEFCTDLAELQKDVDEFNSMAQSGAAIDELQVQAQAVAADAKNLSATTQRLKDEQAKSEMNAAAGDLSTALAAVDAADSYEAASAAAVKGGDEQVRGKRGPGFYSGGLHHRVMPGSWHRVSAAQAAWPQVSPRPRRTRA
jgi:hypothetical protein